MENTNNFEGVFKFTNPTDEDFVALWNNKEYVFPAQTTCPIIIANESLENIQEIRKKFAYKLAVREFYSGKEYSRLVKLGEKSKSGMPPTFDEKVLEPMIEMCLKPLPMAQAKVTTRKSETREIVASKAISEKDNPNFVFRDEADRAQALGVMPDKQI